MAQARHAVGGRDEIFEIGPVIEMPGDRQLDEVNRLAEPVFLPYETIRRRRGTNRARSPDPIMLLS